MALFRLLPERSVVSLPRAGGCPAHRGGRAPGRKVSARLEHDCPDESIVVTTADLLRRAGDALGGLSDCPPDTYEEDCRWVNHGHCRAHPGLFVALTRELAEALVRGAEVVRPILEEKLALLRDGGVLKPTGVPLLKGETGCALSCPKPDDHATCDFSCVAYRKQVTGES